MTPTQLHKEQLRLRFVVRVNTEGCCVQQWLTPTGDKNEPWSTTESLDKAAEFDEPMEASEVISRWLETCKNCLRFEMIFKAFCVPNPC